MQAGLLTGTQGLIDQSLLSLSGDGDIPPDWQLMDGSKAPSEA